MQQAGRLGPSVLHHLVRCACCAVLCCAVLAFDININININTSINTNTNTNMHIQCFAVQAGFVCFETVLGWFSCKRVMSLRV